MFLFQLLHQPVHDQAAGHGVITGTVMVEVRQAQGIGYDIQLEPVQLGQQVLGKDQGIRRGIVVIIAQAVTLCPDEPCVEIGVVGHQHPVADKRQEFGQHFFDRRRTFKHIVADAR